MIPTRPVLSNVPLAHPRMMVSDFIHVQPKEWDVDMLELLVVTDYTVKSGYA